MYSRIDKKLSEEAGGFSGKSMALERASEFLHIHQTESDFIRKMDREFADIRDPGVSGLFPGHNYNLSGIVNGPFDTAAFQVGAWALRIPLITISQTQVVVEVWNKSKEMEPRLGSNWKNLQFSNVESRFQQK